MMTRTMYCEQHYEKVEMENAYQFADFPESKSRLGVMSFVRSVSWHKHGLGRAMLPS